MTGRAVAVVAEGVSGPVLQALGASFETRAAPRDVVEFTRALAHLRGEGGLALDAARRPEDPRPIVAVVPSSSPALVFAAWASGAGRVVVEHRGTVPHSRTLRAAFAIVDWTLVDSPAEEQRAIASGADPERLLDLKTGLFERLLLDPPRVPRRRGAAEAVLSLALDAAEASGALGLLERLTPDRGVNVVNYHRVLPVPELHGYCRPEMAIGEPVFAAQLEMMMQCRGFTRVDRIRDPQVAGRVVITFDDGYEDNFRVALPVLRRFSTPACIFLVTNLVGEPAALWWDRLGLALFAYWRAGCPGPLPTALPERACALRTTRSFTCARAIISGVISDLNGATKGDRDAAVAAAEALLPDVRARRTMLTWEEVRAMASLGVMFGAHTQNHVPLDEVPLEVAREELFGSQRELDVRLSHDHPRMAALPRGRLGPVTEEEMRREGFEAIMTTEPGVNRPEDESLFIRRRDGRMLTLYGRHHPAKLRLELTGLVDRLRAALETVANVR